MELTAAGQLRIYTVFPFNSEALPTETKSGANVGNLFGILATWFVGYLSCELRVCSWLKG